MIYFLGFLLWLLLGWFIAACKEMITGFNIESFFACLLGPFFIIGDLLEAVLDSLD